jgi:hypothetical protein
MLLLPLLMQWHAYVLSIRYRYKYIEGMVWWSYMTASINQSFLLI